MLVCLSLLSRPYKYLHVTFQIKLVLEQERYGKLELELQRVKRKADELESAVAKEKQLGQQKIDIEKRIIQELKRDLLTVEGQRDNFSAQVTGTALSEF